MFRSIWCVDYTTVIELLRDNLCKVLLESSVGLNLDENKLLFDTVFKYIDEVGRLAIKTKLPHIVIPSEKIIFLHLHVLHQ